MRIWLEEDEDLIARSRFEVVGIRLEVVGERARLSVERSREELDLVRLQLLSTVRRSRRHGGGRKDDGALVGPILNLIECAVGGSYRCCGCGLGRGCGVRARGGCGGGGARRCAGCFCFRRRRGLRLRKGDRERRQAQGRRRYADGKEDPRFHPPILAYGWRLEKMLLGYLALWNNPSVTSL